MVNEAAGWRAVYFTLAGLVAFLGLPVVFFGLRRRVEPIAQTHEGQRRIDSGIGRREAVRDPRFYFMLGIITLFSLMHAGLSVNLVPMLIERGYSSSRAAQIASLLGLSAIAGRLAIGWLLDRTRPSYVGAAIFSVGAVGAGLFLLDNPILPIVTVIAIGWLLGSEFDLISYMAARYFGTRHFGEIFGLLYSVNTAASLVGPLFAGIVLINFSHEALYGIGAIAFTIATLLCVLLSRFEER